MLENVIACLKNVYNEESDSTVDVEDIQDNVERCLMSSGLSRCCKILYHLRIYA